MNDRLRCLSGGKVVEDYRHHDSRTQRFLAEILGSVIRRYGSQVTWPSLAADRSIDHPMTVADYVQLLAQMDVLIVQHALREDRLTAAPKKARKVVLSDPFIFHAVRSWLDPVDDPFTAQTGPAVANREWAGKLAEACAAAHHYRMHPTYYIKGDGEVDIAFVSGATFSPIEVKWTSQVRSTDLKQARKYRNSVICRTSCCPCTSSDSARRRTTSPGRGAGAASPATRSRLQPQSSVAA